MIQGHEDALAFLHQAQDGARDPDLRALIGKTIPVVETHEQLAADLLSKRDGHSMRMGRDPGPQSHKKGGH
jgi:predicted outer membrane protein